MRPGIRPLIGAALLLVLLAGGHFMSASVDAPYELGEMVASTTPDTSSDAAGNAPEPPAPTGTATPAPTGTAMPVSTGTATSAPTRTPTAAVVPLGQRFEAREDDIVTLVTPGVYHVRRVTDDPLRINVLLFDITAPQFDIRVALGDGWLSGRSRTSEMVIQNRALAGINGDLFAGGGIPQGMTMIDSRVAMPPKYRATFAWSKDRQPFIGYFTESWTWDSEVIAPGGRSRTLYRLNWPCAYDEVCLFNEFARVVPYRAGDVKVLLTPTGRVDSIYESSMVTIPPGMQVLQGTGEGAEWLLDRFDVGDPVTLHFRTDPPLAQFSHAISGGPIILDKGRFVQDCFCTIRDCSAIDEQGLLCEDFSYEWKDSHYRWVQMPRTGVGYDKERQTLIVAVVDGYQLGYSRGVKQREFADLLREFGAYTAMELDGGGSTTMVLQDEIVNRPSDDTGERYVANALLFYWNDDTSEPEYTAAQPLPRPYLQPK